MDMSSGVWLFFFFLFFKIFQKTSDLVQKLGNGKVPQTWKTV